MMSQSAIKRASRVVPHTLKWHGRLAATMIYGVVRAMAAATRFTWTDQSGILVPHPSQPVIFCIWHNRLAYCLTLYTRFVQPGNPSRRMAALVSASRDGAILARVLEYFKVQPVRGSSSRRGPQALLEMTTWADQGFDLAITPDGPRGPRYQIQPGIIGLAQVTGYPIIPVNYHLSWKKCLQSWDHFQVPLPFTRCEAALGPAVIVPRNASDEERETCRIRLQETMVKMTRD